MAKKPRFLRTRLDKFVILFGLCFFYSHAVNAYVRNAPYAAYIDTDNYDQVAQLAFGPGGFFALAGGVVFNGKAKFYSDDANGTQPISPLQVALTVDGGGLIYLTISWNIV